MSSEKEAVAAQNALNNTFLPNDQGKINVYLSELAELKLPQKNFKFAKGCYFINSFFYFS